MGTGDPYKDFKMWAIKNKWVPLPGHNDGEWDMDIAGPECGITKVIEKSAYDALQAKLDKAVEAIDFYVKWHNQTKANNAALKAQGASGSFGHVQHDVDFALTEIVGANNPEVKSRVE